MTDTMVQSGNAVRISAVFALFNGTAADPDLNIIAVKTYDAEGIALLTDGVATRDGVGLYHYDYVVPTTGYDPLVYEFSGTLEGSAVVGRGKLHRKWVL